MANEEVRLSVFRSEIIKKLRPDNGFARYSRSASAADANAEKVIIPQAQAGQKPTLGGVNSGYYTKTNNLAAASTLSGVIRVNDRLEYSMNILKFPNSVVFETMQESPITYDKLSAVIEEQAAEMDKAIAEYYLAAWAQDNTNFIIGTTGIDSAAATKTRTSVVTGGYAGTVKRFQYEDLLALESAIMRQNYTNGSWYALPTVEQWEDMRRIANIIDFEKTGNTGMLEKGIVGKWGRINYLDPRQNDDTNANVLYDLTAPAAPVPVAYGGTVNANCVSAMLVWNDDAVEKAFGGVKMFERKRDPEYLGDIYNWACRLGASKRRLDGRGVIAVYETPNA